MSYSPEAIPSGQSQPPPPVQIVPKQGKPLSRNHWPRWAILIAVVLLLTGAALLVPRWPYSQKVLVPTLQDTFKAEVKFQRFRHVYFPHPGCELESLTLTRSTEDSTTPLVIIQKMVVTGRYTDFLFRPHHLGNIILDGLYVRIPPHSGRAPFTEHKMTSSKISIGAVTTNGAVLEIENASHTTPLKFQIHWLRVESIAAGQAMSYQLTMGIPEPPGELESKGGFGPWQPGHVAKTPLHGTVSVKDASLGNYHGVNGTVQSEDRFSGTLDQIYVSGEAAAKDFEVKTAGHAVSLTTQFQVMVNAMNGEVSLRSVVAKVGQTTAHAQGTIAQNMPRGPRETLLDFTIQHGRSEDLLWLFNSERKVAMTGIANCSGHVQVPDFGSQFLEHLVVNGRFAVSQGHFQEDTQTKTNELSARAQGKKIKDPSEAPEIAVDELASDVSMRGGVAHFANLRFKVPGANVHMHGTYNFLNHQVDLHGDLRTQAALSQNTSGIKAVLLKPLNPFFHKKHAGAQVPVMMNGPIHNPHFGIELPAK